MAREKTNIVLDTEFKVFLEHLRETTGTPISRIVEIATKEKYKAEYEQFLKFREKGAK